MLGLCALQPCWEFLEIRKEKWSGDICILMVDSHCCMAETNTTLYITLQIKINLKKESLNHGA